MYLETTTDEKINKLNLSKGAYYDIQFKKCKCIKSEDFLIKDNIYLYRKIKNYSIFNLKEEIIDIINEKEFNESFIDLIEERKQKLLKLQK